MKWRVASSELPGRRRLGDAALHIRNVRPGNAAPATHHTQLVT